MNLTEQEIQSILNTAKDFNQEQQRLIDSLITPLEGIKTLCSSYGIQVDLKFTRIDNK